MEHAEPLYRICDNCHGSGQTQHLKVRGSSYRTFMSKPIACPACEGKGHTKKYPANAPASHLCV
ncbi:hypothetical protein [Nonomuraea sp. NPDC050202]|uniref:hypothetical protein n=1 Tax=Nonomuraea sp. NPDC050202 TaxID=3155035 RepID=UPI0033D73789